VLRAFSLVVYKLLVLIYFVTGGAKYMRGDKICTHSTQRNSTFSAILDRLCVWVKLTPHF
jgi:hypothetical protein